MIKTWNERCEDHPDHQTGMISSGMIQARMQEEIDDLRVALKQPEPETDEQGRPMTYWGGKQRPQNCGTGYCSCIECVMEPSTVLREKHDSRIL